MAQEKIGETIQRIQTEDGVIHDIDAVTLDGKSASDFQLGNLVTSINASSTDAQYPSAKCMWDIVGDVEAILKTI